VFLQHRQQVVDVSIVPELLFCAVFVLKGYSIFVAFLLFALFDVQGRQTFEEFRNEGVLVESIALERGQLGRNFGFFATGLKVGYEEADCEETDHDGEAQVLLVGLRLVFGWLWRCFFLGFRLTFVMTIDLAVE
jgi:hypothetical protein